MRVGGRRRKLGLAGKALSGLVVILVLSGASLIAMHDQRAVASSTLPAATPSAAILGKNGLPLPRFVSLKSGRANVRVGPGEDYSVAWVFTRPALPVEVIQEFDNWRRIRDSDGSVGWIFHSLLSGERTAVVAPWASGDALPIRATATEDAAVTAYLQPGVLAGIDRCSTGWCRLKGEGFAGWIEQAQLWGVYPDEELE